MKILFCVTHVGLLRHYGSVLQLLVDRGHAVHVASEESDRGLSHGTDIQTITGGVTGVTFGDVPPREKTIWTAWSYWLHLVMDWVRYFHPRFATAHALRERVEGQVPPWSRALVYAVKRVDPTGRRLMRVLRALDRVTPPSRVIQAFIAEAKPDLVMVSPYIYIGFEQADHVKSAQALGIRTAVCIASWDNLTNKGVIHAVPDRVFVWNHAQREEATSLHFVPNDQVVVTGAQLFDRWFDRQPSRSREEFYATVGLDPAKPFILYTGSSDFIAPREGAFVRSWVRLVRRSADPAVASAGILIRPHPKNYAQFMALDLDGIDNVVIWPRRATTFESSFDSDLFDSLYHSRFVVGINTSAQIEAAIVGRSVRTWRAPDFTHSQAGTLHFQYLAADDGGLVRVAQSAEEHLGHLSDLLASPDLVEERTVRFVESFVRPNGLSVPATRVFADAVEGMAALHPVPQRLPLWAPAGRLLIRPCAALIKAQQPRRRRTDPQRSPWSFPVRVAVGAYVYAALLSCQLGDGREALRRSARKAGKHVRRQWRSIQNMVIEESRRRAIRVQRWVGRAGHEALRSFQRSSRIAGRALRRTGRSASAEPARVSRMLRRRASRQTTALIRDGRRGVMKFRYLAGTGARRVLRETARAYRRTAARSRYLAGTVLRKTGLRRPTTTDTKHERV